MVDLVYFQSEGFRDVVNDKTVGAYKKLQNAKVKSKVDEKPFGEQRANRFMEQNCLPPTHFCTCLSYLKFGCCSQWAIFFFCPVKKLSATMTS
jgi:hypothetical protein